MRWRPLLLGAALALQLLALVAIVRALAQIESKPATPTRFGASVAPAVQAVTGIDGGAVSTASYQSSQWVSWQVQADGGAQPLVPVWAQSLTVYASNAVDVAPDAGTGLLCVAASSCVTSDAGTGPSTTGADAGGLDGTCTWVCYSGTYCPGGLTVVDTDSSNAALVGDQYVQLTPVPPNYGSVSGPLPQDPHAVFRKSSSGTPLLVVGCFQ